MRFRAFAFAIALMLVTAIAIVAAPHASAVVLLDMRVQLDGRVARDRPGEEPIRLEPDEEIPLTIVVRNRGDETAKIARLRLEGAALGLQFLTYDVTLDERVPPGETRTITVPLDLYDLGDQATGYLPATVKVYDGDRNELAEQKFIVDVRGKGTSTLGIFAVALLVLAAVSAGALVYKFFRRQLSRNRAVRGLQFMLAGAAVGLTLALGLPILRITAIQPDGWIALALGPMAIGFALGYLAPGPLSYSIEEARENEALDIVASQAVERLSIEQTAAAVARQSSETVVGASTGSPTPAPATTTTPPRPSGPAPATTTTPPRPSGPAPATTTTPPRPSGP
ncbi:MAG: hypothetical protein ABWZ16_04155, partial [Microbacterium sp.]